MVVAIALTASEKFGTGNAGASVDHTVEFVSANPTGHRLHVRSWAVLHAAASALRAC